MHRWLVLLFLFASASTHADPPAPVLTVELQTLAAEAHYGSEVAVILSFADRLDMRPFQKIGGTHERHATHERRHQIIRALKEKSQDGTRTAIRAFLRARGATNIKPLWLANGIATTVPTALLVELAQWPGIERVRLDAVLRAPTIDYGAATLSEWNLQAVRAPQVWELGYRGQGVTVAILDSGVDGSHPDLRAQYRGGGNSWFDPYGEHAAPYDAFGHGTAVAGIVLGRNGSGSVLGVAPDAQWIAAKIFDDNNQATFSAIHQAFQWLLDPDGDPATNDAPDVVNASWGLIGGAACSMEFERDVQALKAADIAIVFSAGNDGPGSATTLSPGNNPGVLSVGAVDSDNQVALFSSRGPSACGGAIDPELVAPGVSLFTADTSFGLGNGAYAFVSGTSFAAPHVTGAMALLRSARLDLGVAEFETIVRDTARDLGSIGQDNDTGSGLLDVFAALGRVLSSEAPIATADNISGAEDAPLRIDVLANDLDPRGGTLSVTAVASPSARGGVVERNADGTLNYTPAANANGIDRFTYQVSNGRLSSIGTVTVTLTSVNDAPAALDDVVLLTADPVSGVYTLADPGALANDSDVDGDMLSATLAGNVASGTLQLRAAGGFSYTPPAGGTSRGPFSFTYRARDGQTTSNIATVSFTLNRAPVALNDSFSFTTPDADGRYRSASPGVLANDSDADGDSIEASLVTNVAAGAVELQPNGSFVYTPPAGGAPRGAFSFTYQTRDGRGLSNVATVSLNVNRAPQVGDDNLVLSAATSAGPYTLAAPGVLANDSDVDGDPLTALLVRGPARGSLQLAASGALSYTPAAGEVVPGTLDFTYKVNDGRNDSNEALARITFNRAPRIGADNGLVLTLDSDGRRYVSSLSVLANDVDDDGDRLTPVLLTNVGTGSVVLSANGAFIYTPPDAGAPSETLRFTYQVSDGHALSEPGAATFSLYQAPVAGGIGAGGPGPAPLPYTGGVPGAGVPGGGVFDAGGIPSPAAGGNTQGEGYDTPVPAVADAASSRNSNALARDSTAAADDADSRLLASDDDFVLDEPNERGQYVIDAPGVLANDRAGERVSAVLVQNVRSGKVTLLPTGRFLYAPPTHGMPTGELSFSYQLREGTTLSRAATVTFRLQTPLAAQADHFALGERGPKGEYRVAAPGVLANDRGPGELRAVLVQDAMAGRVTLMPDGGFTYLPPEQGASKGPISFTYKVSSGKQTSRTATAMFTLPQPFAAQADRFVLAARDRQGRYVLPSPGVLANDSGNGTLKAKLVRNVTAGSVTLAADGSFVYTPPASGPPPGPLSFTYKLSDGKNSSLETPVHFSLQATPKVATASSAARR